jgi:Putative transmembrane protein precursor
MDPTLVIFTISFVCLSFMFGICPPQEFWTSGVTLEHAISSWLGDEQDDFVHYNIRRLSARLLFQSSLPLCKLHSKIEKNLTLVHLNGCDFDCGLGGAFTLRFTEKQL